MPKRRSSAVRDIDEIAVEILEEAVGEPAPMTPTGKKNPAAADSGRARELARGAPKVGAKVKVKVKVKSKVKVKAKGLSVKKRRP